MRRSAARVAIAVVLAACGGDGATPPPSVSSVSIAPEDPTIPIGTSVTLAATARDASGTVITGRHVAWTTSRADVATVNALTGVVQAVGAGFTVVRATIDGKNDQVLITVTAPVASVQVTARRTTVGIAGTLQLTATLLDPTGAALIGRTVTWSSADETKARVSSTGVVTGVGAGAVTITATSEGVRGAINITIADIPPLAISGVAPSTLTPGVTATITGSNFDTNPADLEVTVAGLRVPVIRATPTELTVQLASAMPCQVTQNTAVSVSGVGGTATRAHPLRVASQRSVAVGETLVLGGLDVRCNELPATGGRYALAVVNASRVPGSIASFEFRGLPGAVASASTAPTAAAASPLTWAAAGGRVAGLVSPLRRAAAQRRAHEHSRWLESERRLLTRLGRTPRGALRAAQSRTAAARAVGLPAPPALTAAPVPLEVGATTTLKFRTSDANCTQSKEVPARVVYVGSTSVVLEATDAPLKGTMDADYVALGTEYDNVMYDVLRQYFGDPLAYDDSTDANGKILMVFTKAVNDRSANLLGFVTGCDFFRASTPGFSASNQAEIFYARVPTKTTTDLNDVDTKVGWMHLMRGTLIHESKHIVSFAERFATPEEADFEDSWLEEATAQAAIEFWGRATYYAGKATWKGNATYRNTMYCEVRTLDAGECSGQPSIISDHFFFLFDYYENIETKAYFSSARDDSDIYGSGWLFVRWAADQYATDEAAFFQALTRSWTVTGLSNVEARTGQPFETLHTNFMLTLYADDVPDLTPPSGARYTVPSWSMRDMFQGLSNDFTRNGQPIPPFPLRMHTASFGAFNADVATLLGGAAAYVDLSGTQSAVQVLDLRASGGALLPAETTLRLAILRVQ